MIEDDRYLAVRSGIRLSILTPPLPRRAFETVDWDTPAPSATSNEVHFLVIR